MNSHKSQTHRQQSSIELQQKIGALAETFEMKELDAVTSLGQDERYRLVLYLKRYFGLSGGSKIATDKDSLESLLEANNFHFRKARLGADPGYEQVPVIAKNASAGLVVISHRHGQRVVFELNSETVIPLDTYQGKLMPIGYEIYELFPQDLDSLWKLSQFLLPAIRGDLVIALSFSIIIVLLALASPVLTYEIVGDVLPSGDIQLILAAFVISILLTGFNTVFSFIQSFYLIRINQKLNLKLQLSVVDRILKAPVSFIKNYSVGDLSSRTEAIHNLAELLSSTTLSSLVNSVAVVGYMGLMFVFDSSIAVVALGFTLISTAIQVILAKRQIFYQRQSQAIDVDLFNFSLETIGALPQIRSNACEPFILDRWFASVMKTTGLQFRQAHVNALSSVASMMLGSVGTTLMYAVLVVRMLMAKDIGTMANATSTFLVFFSAYNGFSSRFMQLVDLFNSLLGSALVQAERVMPILTQRAESGYAVGKTEYNLTGQMSLRNVTFAYPGTNEYIFSDLSFDIKPGAFNAIYGPSGCGKSTIFKLILGFYQPCSGSIFIDSHELEELSIRFYRQQLGVIMQKPILPSGSIRNAVSSGKDASTEEIWKALEFANVATEVEAMPMKLDTVLSEGALNISGGQRQRLSIARAILQKPKVLMEDEATSSLDNDSQRIIGENLRKAGLTRIVIAQRLSAVQKCDHMIVINDRRVETQGSYEHCRHHSDYLKSVITKL